MNAFDLPSLESRLAAYASASDSDEPGKRAAVAAILRAGTGTAGAAGAEILLIRRAESPSDPWSGHMALPGGRHDETDRDLEETAIRETREEVGIDLLRDGRRLARLPDHPAIVRGARVGLVIAPFVFALRCDAPLSPNEEIAEALWTPLAPLARGEGAGTFEYDHHGTMFELPCLDVGGRRVWGLTYHMLQELFRALG
jgi:8-oxo-dGTP pyrophosphatase MutT (NUDIX family)